VGPIPDPGGLALSLRDSRGTGARTRDLNWFGALKPPVVPDRRWCCNSVHLVIGSIGDSPTTPQPTRASKCPPPAGFGGALGQRWRQGQPRGPNQLARRRVLDLVGVPASGRGARGPRRQTIRRSSFQPRSAQAESSAVTKQRAPCAKRVPCCHSSGSVSNCRGDVSGVPLGGGSHECTKVRAAVTSQAKDVDGEQHELFRRVRLACCQTRDLSRR
jgi:hypothetical protein